MEKPSLAINIASTGRKKRLADCLRSIDYDNVVVNIGAKEPGDIPFDIVESRNNISVSFSDEYPVQIQNSLASNSAEHSHILFVSDDIVFEPGAIQKAVDALHQIFPDGDGVIGFDVKNLTIKDKCPYAYMLVGNKFFNERLGRLMFFQEYWHFYADMELGEFANRLNKFRTCWEAQLIHHHPIAGAPADATHLYKRQEKHAHDHGIYQKRRGELSEKVGLR